MDRPSKSSPQLCRRPKSKDWEFGEWDFGLHDDIEEEWEYGLWDGDSNFRPLNDCGESRSSVDLRDSNVQDEHAVEGEVEVHHSQGIHKLRGELAVELVERTIRRKAIGGQSSRLAILKAELTVERDKNTLLQERLAKQSKRLVDLQAKASLRAQELRSLEEESRELESKIKKVEVELKDEVEKMLCVICLERRRDAVCMPCMHLCFCQRCLEMHLKQSKTCPSCRAPSQGVFECNPEISLSTSS